MDSPGTTSPKVAYGWGGSSLDGLRSTMRSAGSAQLLSCWTSRVFRGCRVLDESEFAATVKLMYWRFPQRMHRAGYRSSRRLPMSSVRKLERRNDWQGQN
jgi:hypothetical protein